MNPSFSTHNKGSSSVRESILSTTTRPVSRKWKQLVSKLKWFNKRQQPDFRPKSTGQAITSTRNITRRRHSSDELTRTNEYPFYTAQRETASKEQQQPNTDAGPSKQQLHVSLPAGPVCSALSPPPRPSMVARRVNNNTHPSMSRRQSSTNTKQQEGDIVQPHPRRSSSSRPMIQTFNLRLSIDIERQSMLCGSPSSATTSSISGESFAPSISRPTTPFRSGTLGSHSYPFPPTSSAVPPVPDIPPLKERRKRRSPMSIPDDLTLDLKRSSISAASATEIEREKAMDALEGKTSSSASSSSSSSVSSSLSSAIDRDKAQYEAVVARTQRRRAAAAADSPPNSSSSSRRPMISTQQQQQQHVYYPATPNSMVTVIGHHQRVDDNGHLYIPVDTLT
ncbi:predicted protein [Lichtheimia corymbifera JMRC:FSU:9682]|uniref:Uncharacterized protein n=1 Tax=Lichtheimia corymbifera JMRC:FSU:9682 TaxID=1263082 RepID=A0A068RLF5_9FUNG|nr:predicted protein [Lichtheimia corymbifera JMRC:FSU:9682]